MHSIRGQVPLHFSLISPKPTSKWVINIYPGSRRVGVEGSGLSSRAKAKTIVRGVVGGCREGILPVTIDVLLTSTLPS